MAQWFDTSAFVNPATYSFGPDSRTQPDLRHTGAFTWDTVMSRWHQSASACANSTPKSTAFSTTRTRTLQPPRSRRPPNGQSSERRTTTAHRNGFAPGVLSVSRHYIPVMQLRAGLWRAHSCVPCRHSSRRLAQVNKPCDPLPPSIRNRANGRAETAPRLRPMADAERRWSESPERLLSKISGRDHPPVPRRNRS